MSRQEKSIESFNLNAKIDGYKIEKFYTHEPNKNGKLIPRRFIRVFYNGNEVCIVKCLTESVKYVSSKTGKIYTEFNDVQSQAFGNTFKPRKEFNRKFIHYKENY